MDTVCSEKTTRAVAARQDGSLRNTARCPNSSVSLAAAALLSEEGMLELRELIAATHTKCGASGNPNAIEAACQNLIHA